MPPSPSPAIPLRAGPLTALFEPEIGFLRYIRLGSVEIVRGIYAAVREPEWGTPAPQLSDLTVRQSADEFEIRFV
ncbi:MAG: hypothetical protein K0Q72_5099, partial [Armatimonadetes bacterium]|nr:hypothetical protein [Armatimonadota bacterium]